MFAAACGGSVGRLIIGLPSSKPVTKAQDGGRSLIPEEQASSELSTSNKLKRISGRLNIIGALEI